MLVDSDIFIDYLRGRPEAEKFLEAHVDRLHISSISVAELFQGVREGKEREALESMLEALTVLDLTAEIATEGGLLRRSCRKSHGSGLADCLIAATALKHDLEFFTLNLKHYPMVMRKEAPYQK